MVATLEPKANPIAVFNPLTWQIQPWRYTGPIMLLTGSAGGGKSRVAAEKLHGYCLKYPGAQALVTRKTRESMTNGTIPFFEKKIIGDDPRVRHLPSKSRFEYANGSMLAYLGLDDERGRTKLRSFGQDGGVDIAWMEEAIEFEYEDYNELKTRMRGKAAPWRQMILTTNPDADTHWINIHLILAGKAKVFYSNSADNPYNPDDYLQNLAEMTGVRALRMREGKWVRATGLVYDQWLDDYGQVPKDEEKGNVTERAEYTADSNQPVVWAVDDGYAGEVDQATGYFTANSHPRVFLLCQLRGDGSICIFEENYAIRRLSDHHLDEIEALPYPAPDFAVVDKSAAELKGRLNARGLYTRNGANSVEESIKMMRDVISPDSNGVRRLLVHPRCKHFRSEMNSYRLDPVQGKPVKAFDHGPDAARYLCFALRNLHGV